MSRAHLCRECEAWFLKPAKTYQHKRVEYWGFKTTETYMQLVCPECGSEEFKELPETDDDE